MGEDWGRVKDKVRSNLYAETWWEVGGNKVRDRLYGELDRQLDDPVCSQVYEELKDEGRLG